MATAFDPSSITANVYRQVLRHIRQHRLGKGDRLPPQSQWLRALNCGTVPFNNAMRLLESHGVLQRRPTGTTLLRSAPDRPIQWSVGVCMPKLPTLSASYPALFQFLQMHLQEAGARLYPYYLNRKMPVKDFHRLADFDALADDAESGKLDGLLNLLHLTQEDRLLLGNWGVPHCKLVELDIRASGVAIDLPAMIRQATQLLKDRECRRIALLGGINHSWREVFGGTLWDAFEKTLDPIPPLEFYSYGYARAGQEVARRLLDLPPEERPDGLVCVWDDYFALGLTEVLREDSSYRPAIAAFTSRQAALPFFLPVYRYELDLEEVAQKGVRLLLDRLQSPREVDPRARVIPCLNEPEPATLCTRMLMPSERAMIASEGARRMLYALYDSERSSPRPPRTRERSHGK
jgi:DNA-binding LacI/PurR family transcriptional regulator